MTITRSLSGTSFSKALRNRRLASSRAAGNDDIPTRLHRSREKRLHVAAVEKRLQFGILRRPLAARAALRAGKRSCRLVIVERQILHDMFPDREGEVLARGRRGHNLDARAIGQCGGQQRMLAETPCDVCARSAAPTAASSLR